MRLLEIEPTKQRSSHSFVSKRALQQGALADLSAFALGETELKPIMDKAVSLVCETLATDYCKVLQLFAERRFLLLLSGYGWDKSLIGKAVVGTGINSHAGHTLRADKLVIVEDLRKEPRFEGTPLLTDHGVISGMMAPLRGDVGTWGVFGTHCRRKRKFTTVEQNFFQCTVNILSAAILRSTQHTSFAEVNENLQLALNIANVGTWRVDPETMLITRDANLGRICGTSPVDSTHHFEDFISLVHPDDRARILQHFHHSLETHRFTQVDYRIIRPDGEIRWFHTRGKMLRAGYVTGATIDITDRKYSEDARARLAAIVESSQDAILSITLDGIITTWNPGAERLFQFAANEVIGQSMACIVPEDRHHEFEAVLRKLKEGTRPESFETIRMRKDRSTVAVSISVSFLRNGSHSMAGASIIFRDITRRKTIERTLQQNEARLQIALEAGQMGTWEWQIDSKKMFWSPSMEKIHGLLPGSFEGTFEAFASDVCPEHQSMVLRQISEALERKSNLKVEYRLLNGTWVEGRGSVILDDQGNVTRIVGVCMDTSHRKQAETNLRESEERFRSLADAAPVMIWMSGPDGLATYFNKGWFTFRGRNAEQEFGFGWTEGVHPDDRERCLLTYKEALEQRKAFQSTYRLKRHDGEYRDVLVSGVPRFDGNDDFSGFVGSSIDITHIKRAERALHEEAALRASEERFREMADAMPHIVWEASVDGFFEYFNQRWQDYTGMAVTEGGNDVWEAIVHPDDWPACFESWKEALSKNNSCDTECRLKNFRTGEYRWHLTRSLPIRDKDGNVLRWIGTATDIEDQKQIQGELSKAKEALSERAITLETAVKARTRELEESLKTTETLIYTIAHDLRAPLRAMQGLSLAVLEDYAFRLDNDGREILNRINQAAMRMDKLISDLLAYGRLGYVELAFENLDLNAQVDFVLAGFADDIHQAKAQVIRATLPGTYGNATVLRQILANLIGNALKFVLPGAHPRVEIFAETTKPGVVRLVVKDNGIGIDSHHLQKVFEVFQRLHTQDDYPGTGIGLAMVAKAAQRLGGVAGVESEPGKGSSFWVELPAAKETEPQTAPDQKIPQF